MKRTVSALLVILTVIATLSVCSVNTYAATSGKTGSCQWSVNGTVLTISGNGPMANELTATHPWDYNITEVIIKEGVTTIGNHAFHRLKELVKVTIPSTVKYIGEFSFYECVKLSTIELPEGVTSIGDCAFYGCESLLDITIPKNVTYIGVPAFSSCFNLQNIFVDPENKKYTSVDGILFNKDKSVLIRYPSDKPDFYYTVPESVVEISSFAFDAAWNLLDITLPDSVLRIGSLAFYRTIPYNTASNRQGGGIYIGNHLVEVYDEKITQFNVKAGTVTIAEECFSNNPNLRKVIIPDGVISIGRSAFYYCTRLSEIVLPESLKYVGDAAFTSCKALKTIRYRGSEPDKKGINFGKYNDELLRAAWEYDACNNGVAHSYNTTGTALEPTCTATGIETKTCTRCGHVITAELGMKEHSFGEWTIEVSATCEGEGVSIRRCVGCEKTETKTIEPCGHSYSETAVVIEESYYKPGLTRTVCANCGDVIEGSIPSLKEQGVGISPLVFVGGGALLVAIIVGVTVGMAVKVKKKKEA